MTIVDWKSGHKEPWHLLQLAFYTMGKHDPEIEFREKEHRYFYRDRELVSVTKLAGGTGKFYPHGSAERGHAVHKMVALYLQTILDEQWLDPLLTGYLAALKKFLDGIEPYQVVTIEQVVGDPSLGFAGRVDAILDFKGGPPAMDVYLKTDGSFRTEPLVGANFSWGRGKAHSLLAEHRQKERLRI